MQAAVPPHTLLGRPPLPWPAGLWEQAGMQAKVPVVALKQEVQASRQNTVG